MGQFGGGSRSVWWWKWVSLVVEVGQFGGGSRSVWWWKWVSLVVEVKSQVATFFYLNSRSKGHSGSFKVMCSIMPDSHESQSPRGHG